jgi:uncharacterized integral membrane protein
MNEMPSVAESFDGLEQPYDWQNVPKYRGGNRVTRNKLNPVTPKARRVAGALKMPMTRSAGGARLPKGAATSSGDSGYWNLIVGAMFLLFLLYIVAHNEVQAWANILFWSPSKAVQVGDSPTAGAVQAAAVASAAQTNPASGVPGFLFALPSLIQGAGGGLGGAGAPGVAATPQTPWGSGPGGILGSGFWNGPAGSILKRFGYGK